jgi:AcrR family transcriptional regulator
MNVPAHGKRAQRRAQRREDVLDAAMRIIVGEGLGAMTIQRLAKATGASVGGLYRYYESKESVIAALQLRAIGVFAEVQRGELARGAEYLASRSSNLHPHAASLFSALVSITSYLRFERRDPERHRLFDAFLSASEALLPDAAAQEVDAAVRPLIASIAARLDDAADCGALGPSDGVQRTYVVWAAMHGLDHFRKRDRIMPTQLRVSALREQTLLALFAGWGGDRDRFAEAYAQLAAFETLELERLAEEQAQSAAIETDIAAS